HQLVKKEKDIQNYQQIRDAISQFIVGLIIVAMIVWTSIQVDANNIQPTVIAAFILMIFSITDALLPMSEAMERVPTYIDSLERITQVENNPAPRLNRSTEQIQPHQTFDI